MKITDIEKQKKNEKRYNIYVNGEFLIGLDENVVAEHRLFIGKEMDENLINKLNDDEYETKLFNLAVNYATYKDRTEMEVVKRLKKEDVETEIIEKIIKKMTKYRFINDELYANNYINTYKEKYSYHKIKNKLKEKGIDPLIIEDKMTGVYDTDNEVQKALVELNKMTNSLKRYEGIKKKQSAIRRLAYRGFDYDTINQAWEIYDGD